MPPEHSFSPAAFALAPLAVDKAIARIKQILAE